MKSTNKPAIRFKGYNDAWEQRKFGDVLETVTDYVAAGSFADLRENVIYKDSPDYAQLVRTVDFKNGFMSSSPVYVDKHAFDFLYRVNLDKDSIILPNIGNCGEVYFIRPEALPYTHNVLGPNAIMVRSDSSDNQFLSILFQGTDFQEKLKLIVSPNGQTKFNKTELKQIILVLPTNIAEQSRLGKFFSELDHLITLHQRKLEKLKNIKNSMLEKMFPKNYKDVPEIRFSGFTEAWEQRKLGELAKRIYGGGTPATMNELFWNGNIPWIQSSDIIDGKLFGVKPRKSITQEGLINSATQLVPKNSIAIITRVGVGKLAFIPFSYTTSQDFVSLSVLNTEPYFTVYACYKKLQSELNAVQGTSIKGITKNELLAKSIMVPKYNEQRKIGIIFKQIDNLITLHQRKLEKLQNIKKSCLEKMFV